MSCYNSSDFISPMLAERIRDSKRRVKFTYWNKSQLFVLLTAWQFLVWKFCNTKKTNRMRHSFILRTSKLITIFYFSLKLPTIAKFSVFGCLIVAKFWWNCFFYDFAIWSINSRIFLLFCMKMSSVGLFRIRIRLSICLAVV